ncbi:MAG: hypothetical protein QOG53_2207 [Frankiales bacterium]|nr:hypothetical protein [Frankiales bacterium]
MTAKGSAGACSIGKDISTGAPIGFNFTATEADYPGLGQSLNFSEDIGSHKLTMKWLIAQGNSNVWFGYMTSGGVTISPDHHSLTLDADLPKNPDHPEHVKGTIACP